MKNLSLLTACNLIFLLLIPCFVLAGNATLSWQVNTESDLAGYRIYYGTSSRTYGPSIDVGNVTSHSITGLDEGIKYYFTVTALDSSENESGYSEEVNKVIETSPPIPTPTPTPDVLVYWDAMSNALNIFQEGDSGDVSINEADFVEGKEGQGIQINSRYANGSFACTNGNNIDKNQGAISFWYKKTGYVGSYAKFFKHSSKSEAFSLNKLNNNTLGLAINSWNTQKLDISGSNLFDGNWHHVKLTWNCDEDNYAIYIDNKLYDEDNSERTAPQLNSGSLYIGNNKNGKYPINGIIDEFYIYNK